MRGICAYWEGKYSSDQVLAVSSGGLTPAETDFVSIRDKLATFSLYLTRKQAVALCDALAEVLNVPYKTSLDNASDTATIESLIVSRDRLLDACARLGIAKESEVNHESV